jgi:hypothetical protein
MPLSKHYGGHGRKVWASMVKQYGEDRAKQIFYATENARKSKGVKKKLKRKA